MLGPKWSEATPAFRLLVPTVLGFALINPFGWFLVSSGRVVQSLRMAFLITPTVILGVLADLCHGSTGLRQGSLYHRLGHLRDWNHGKRLLANN